MPKTMNIDSSSFKLYKVKLSVSPETRVLGLLHTTEFLGQSCQNRSPNNRQRCFAEKQHRAAGYVLRCTDVDVSITGMASSF